MCENNLEFTENAMRVLNQRYLKLDDDGNIIETPYQLFDRVATYLSSVEKDNEKWRNDFLKIMVSKEFLPAGRTLAIAGTGESLVSNCVVLHPADNIDDIFNTLHEAAIIHKQGSGIGFPFHLLRPTGEICNSNTSHASGPLHFIDLYSNAFRSIKQHGREPANMGLMRIDHPDILEFISAKCVEGNFSNFNFSIAITDEFMRQVIEEPDKIWMCNWKGTPMKPRYITRTGNVPDVTEVDITAGELFDEIVKYAWSNGEPGCVFIDTVNKTNPLPGLGPIECCNPCGEQFLHSGDACNLGAINLEKFVKHNKVDFDHLREVTKIAVRLLDNVIDKTEFAVKRVQDTFQGNRRLGLGIMGLADMLFLLKIPYDSEEGRKVASDVMKCIQETAIEESVKIGKEKGNFPNFDKSVWKEKYSTMRNASLTNVAPTGSTSMLFDVSSGIEPYFALAYRRVNVLNGTPMDPFVNKHLKKALEDYGCYTDEIMNKILEKGTLRDVKEVPETLRKVFVTSLDISAENHVKMQSTVQKYCCNAISKTINFPFSASVSDVKKAYINAWKAGIKGITVYRNGSRDSEVFKTNAEKTDEPVETCITTCKDGKCDL